MISTIAFILLVGALIVQVVFLMRRDRRIDPVSHYILLGAALLLFANLVERSIKIKFVAITNTFESLVFFSGAIALVVFIYRMRSREKTLPFLMFGATITAIILLSLTSSPISDRTIAPPIPALQSYWLVLHVTFAFIGEAFFALAFVAAIYFLAVKNEEQKKRAEMKKQLDNLYGYENQEEDQQEENMFVKMMKYLEQMRERQRVRMRQMVD